MAQLPDPTTTLNPQALAAYNQMAKARAGADGRAALGEVYVRMFNDPAIATKVGALGDQLRFHGVLPDHIREAIILRYASKNQLGYEWSHHQRPAQMAGLTEENIQDISNDIIPTTFDAVGKAALQAVNYVSDKQSIPSELQTCIVNTYGEQAIVELVALCGLYAIMGYFCMAFDIEIEKGFPEAPNWNQTSVK